VRVTDVVARIGGEEFVVLLPQTRLDAAVQLAEKLLRTLQQSPAQVARGVSIGFTASLGVGSLPAGHSSTVAALYAAADHALYEAKRLGRNRVEKTEPDGNLTPSDFQRMRRQ
jgi:diguanylate cyclase (GGDEF)-like protein